MKSGTLFEASALGMHPGTREDILACFRERGVRCTSQRFAILEHLAHHPDHPTAEQIHEAINRADPRASLATVYKALHAMADAGLIRELQLGGNAARFEAVTGRHHHFLCERCGGMEDIEWFEVPELLKKRAAGRRVVRDCEVILRGLCAACACH